MKKLFPIILVLCLFFLPEKLTANDQCVSTILNKNYCAPSGGTAIETYKGEVVCALGNCVTDNLGYIKCSGEKGGGATTDNMGRVACVGGCVSPRSDLCILMNFQK